MDYVLGVWDKDKLKYVKESKNITHDTVVRLIGWLHWMHGESRQEKIRITTIQPDMTKII